MSWFKSLLRRWSGIDEELTKKLAEVDARLAEIHEPKATETKDENGTLTVTQWNHAYAEAKRTSMPPELTVGKTDDEIVQLWVDRYNHEHVEPKLEVVHSGIDKMGRIKMKLEWNDAFIRLLQEQGIVGDTEEKMIENYLALMTRKVDAELFDEEEGPKASRELPNESDIERELENMDPEVVKRLEKTLRRRAQLKSPRKRNIDK